MQWLWVILWGYQATGRLYSACFLYIKKFLHESCISFFFFFGTVREEKAVAIITGILLVSEVKKKKVLNGLSVHDRWWLLIENEKIITVLRVMEETRGTWKIWDSTGTRKSHYGSTGNPLLSVGQHPIGQTYMHNFILFFTLSLLKVDAADI